MIISKIWIALAGIATVTIVVGYFAFHRPAPVDPFKADGEAFIAAARAVK